jgi:hypothetical protein
MTTTQPEFLDDRDDSVSEMILTRRKRRLPILTAILVLAAAAGGAFIGGAEIQKHYGTAATSSSGTGAPSASALAARFRAAGGFPGGAGAGATGGTAGTVTLIKGSTLYVTDTSGNTVAVRTTSGSRVTKTVSGSVQTIHPGDTITVTGKQAKNGSYTASAITIASSGNG